MKYILTFLASILTFLGLDAVWIKFVAQPELTKIASGYLAAQPNLAAAIIFYLIYIIGVLFISLKFSDNPKAAAVNGLILGVLAYLRPPQNLLPFKAIQPSATATQALTRGALLGLVAYGTYELTNMATLANWSWKMVILDTTWGGILTAITCFVGYRVYSKLSKTGKKA